MEKTAYFVQNMKHRSVRNCMAEHTTAYNAYEFNSIQNRKTFDVSAILTAYHFDSRVSEEPYWEQYGFSQIFMVLDGRGSYVTEEGEFPFCPGMMFYRPAHLRSCYKWEPGQVKFALISFVCDSPAMEVFGLKPLHLKEEESATLLDVIRTTVRVCEPMKASDARLGMRVRESVPDVVMSFIYASLERFLALLYCRLRNIRLLTDEDQKVSRYLNDSQLVARVKGYLRENVGRTVTILELCGQFGISQTALMRKFRRETGKSIMAYFTDIKIELAKTRIRDSSDSFTVISESLGFGTVHYFSKVFKDRTGLTPTEYSRKASKRRTAVGQIGKG